MFELTGNFDQFLKAFGEAEKAANFARVVALTRTARATAGSATSGGSVNRGFLSEEASRVFDRPTPRTLGGFYFRPATPDKSAFLVGVKDMGVGSNIPAAKFLAAQILGGARRKKRSEVALTSLMGNRGYWVPGPGLTLDAYGNVPGGTIRRILSDLKVAETTSGFAANRTARSTKRNRNYRKERYFVPKPGSKLAPGVWVRRGRDIAPALFFITEAHYDRRFDFFGRGMAFATARFPIELAQALREGWNLPRNVQKAMGLGGRI